MADDCLLKEIIYQDSKESDTEILQSIYFAYQVGNVNFFSNRINMQIFYNIYNIYFYLTTTSGRPEPECTLRRVMSSEPIQGEQ